jgi:hypothetical protein
MKVKFWITIGDGKQEEVVEVPDDYSDMDILIMLDDWIDNYIDYGWTKE